ncbi:type IV toxin-antitoxin system AbiEi family antitoxin domain-containing protein [Actinoplanes sp. NPDC023936]|uniref:type IV toxin-antitoxin system AbiEi family antitoxin domain-containing protein n=1 Tax=Actinoplanes sp. NPDC023936 TaxID=3154910 RepID=UPI0033F58BE0
MTRHIDEISRHQRGVLTRAQALRSGMSPDRLRNLHTSGRWQRLHRGVYATFSGEVPRPALRWAAVLAAGRGAMLSHRSAAEEAGLADEGHGPIHILIPDDRRVRPSTGLVVHRAKGSATRRHPVRLPPQTRVEDTVLDLASAARSEEEAMAWIAAACGRRLTTPARIARALADRPRLLRRRGLAVLLGEAGTGVGSVLEWRYLRDVERAHALPPGARQQRRSRPGGSWYDDVHYLEHGVRVELDGLAAHPPEGRLRDFRRDNAAVRSGECVLRYGSLDVGEDPCGVAAQVAGVLRSRGWRGSPQQCGAGCRLNPHQAAA